MEQAEWFDVWYPKIAQVLGLNTEGDLESAKLLDDLTDSIQTFEDEARRLIEGSTCVVFGGGPSLKASFDALKLGGQVTVAADGAARLFMEKGLPPPHVVVTDLDGGDDVLLWCAAEGSILVVHAHGDNMAAMARLVPKLVGLNAKMILTCQVRPFSKLRNFFGFTDGDRAAWFCHAMGAKKIVLVGMDFGEVVGEYSKPKGHPNPRLKIAKLRLGFELVLRLAEEAEVYTFRGSPRLDGIREATL